MVRVHAIKHDARRFLSATSGSSSVKSQENMPIDDDSLTMIYEKHQSSMIRLMLGISAVNLYVSSYFSFHS